MARCFCVHKEEAHDETGCLACGLFRGGCKEFEVNDDLAVNGKVLDAWGIGVRRKRILVEEVGRTMNYREHINFQHTVDTLVNIIELGLEDGQPVRAIAEELVEYGYVKPNEPSRVWVYGKGQWDGSWICLGGDEFGNRPLVIRLPGERALLLNLAPKLKRRYWEDR